MTSARHGLTLAHARALAAAYVALIVAQLTAWLVPRGRLVAPDEASERAAPAVTDADRRRAVRVASLINVASSRGPFRPNCLVRSIALRWMLRRHGLEGSALHVGVRRNGDGIEAHAWVTFGGAVLGDASARVASYRQLRLRAGRR